MKPAVLSLAVACCTALPALPSHAQAFDDRCFAVGDVAAQISGWRKRGKTKAQALAQSHKYYGDGPDSQAVDKAIAIIYAAPTLPNPDQATMLVTQDCLREKRARQAGTGGRAVAAPAPAPASAPRP
ncbi:hypothetical protein [Burkholderia glumae]|uniref:hypothetical protein n=1 Tax=Burkholderia glumae TaxID=337 RepID=UPI0013745900|nr:hypothetical protein [Burkholderia glumae]MCR1768698.1 hypothetical protein [Burkholderia glumae]QHP93067.1 hypothetical protein EXE55_19145 [Burkholderia glumae]QKM50649.1 hypothetical protein B7760_04714 [Burkholderia glumae]UVS99293.1 hypothetical protein EFP19_27335 [Burkholderia glumae]